jgi:heme oxygenase
LQDSSVPEEARHFFRSYGAEVGEKWKAFIRALEGFAAGAGEAEGIVNGANSAFASMEGWICGAADRSEP